MSFLSTIFGHNNEASDKIVVLDKIDYASAISNKKVQLVDVRTANEFSGGHIKNALNIDFFNAANFEISFSKLDKTKPVYIYCRSGARSQKAAKKLVDMGFSQIFDLKGGYSRWS
ncbi:rhodanese-like domain-containing protein [Zobellia galactanivorans]|uniref:Thiosulfate sulfurtransferase n=1 Tax=Zobellia galactanivorans (strain DSM 12802 / CCUG 47099 / CIP 106680 / NCIMB 13871 / Dsij) TaxID=63186 RepID=G0L0F0_ZOBGA|nr:rhodanese-like domain-containing protein [Zobellia galactanivorans]MBU3025584.1 rhodanese-like domain-containing protein [Zobellia galactanivorans]MDO6809874.1 rhodanese-like domain-containing protein [Zobellia galactanivorans]CAZ94369.1 Thiosulfate sulfurtransferase [Zobellia galactanivorans]